MITFDPDLFTINPLHNLKVKEIGRLRSRIIEIDDILMYPTEVVDFLKQIPMQDAVRPAGRKPPGFYPGYQTYLTYDFFFLNYFIDKVSQEIFGYSLRKPSWSFQSIQNDRPVYKQSSSPHSDAGTIAGNIFLNTSDTIEPESGTAFYCFKDTEEESFFPNSCLYRKERYTFLEPDLTLEKFNPVVEDDKWLRYYISEDKFNRLNLYEGALFHSSFISPGTYINSPRMTMSFID